MSSVLAYRLRFVCVMYRFVLDLQNAKSRWNIPPLETLQIL